MKAHRVKYTRHGHLIRWPKYLNKLAALLAAFILLALAVSCSPSKKLELCQEWAKDHPETFATARDTLYLTDTIPGDTIRQVFTLSQLSQKPLKWERPGLSLSLRREGKFIFADAYTPARIDTLIIYRDQIQPAAPVNFWRAPHRWRWLQLGGLLGFILALWVFSIVKRR